MSETKKVEGKLTVNKMKSEEEKLIKKINFTINVVDLIHHPLNLLQG